MSRKSNWWDNACVESFFKSLKSELIGTTIYESREAAMQAVFEYIESSTTGSVYTPPSTTKVRSNTRRRVQSKRHNDEWGQIVKNSPTR